MKKIHIIFIVMLGFLLTPSISFACGSGKHSCKKEISNTPKKTCCADHGHSENSKGCSGKCGHKSCGCASACVASAALLQTIELNGFAYPPYLFKANFHYPKNLISSGFYSLWLIPKIS
ncbi:MAG: hypothetical protein EOO51_11570 [Flavobacterium sp.]|nr:MAG: hypothetical protein EOO51_11570 [Flavobacterium sp.]